MMVCAAESQADVIMSEFVYMGPECAGGSGVYQRWRPEPHKLVKSMFFIRKSKFSGFSGKPKSRVAASADQVLGQELGHEGATFARAEGLVNFHN